MFRETAASVQAIRERAQAKSNPISLIPPRECGDSPDVIQITPLTNE